MTLMSFRRIDWYYQIVTYYSKRQKMDGHGREIVALNGQIMKKFNLKIVVVAGNAPTSAVHFQKNMYTK